MHLTEEQFKKIEALLERVVNERDTEIEKKKTLLVKVKKLNNELGETNEKLQKCESDNIALRNKIKTLDNSALASSVVLRETMSMVEDLNKRIICLGKDANNNDVDELLERFDRYA